MDFNNLKDHSRWYNPRSKRFWAVIVVLAYTLLGFFAVPAVLRQQVPNLAQEFKAVLLRLDRVGLGVADPAEHLDPLGLDFEGLAAPTGLHQLSRAVHGAAAGQLLHFVRVIIEFSRRHHLDGAEAGAVGHVQEGEPGLGITAGPNPAFDRDRFTHRNFAGEALFNAEGRHGYQVESDAEGHR